MYQYSDQILGPTPDFEDSDLSYEQAEEIEKHIRKLKKQVKDMRKGKKKSKKKMKELKKQLKMLIEDYQRIMELANKHYKENLEERVQVLELQCQQLQQEQLLQEATSNAFLKLLGLTSGPMNLLPSQTQPVNELPAPRDQ